MDDKCLIDGILANDDGQSRIDHVFDFLACLVCLVHFGYRIYRTVLFDALQATMISYECLSKEILKNPGLSSENGLLRGGQS